MVSPQLEPQDQIAITLSRLGQAVIVHVTGEIDLATRDALAEVVFDQFVTAPQTLVIDLSGVGFMGSAGLGLLVEVARRAESNRIALQIVVATSPVLRSLEISGLDAVLPICRTIVLPAQY